MRLWPFKRRTDPEGRLKPYMKPFEDWDDVDCAAYLMLAAMQMENKHTLMNCIVTMVSDRQDIAMSETKTLSVRISIVADRK